MLLDAMNDADAAVVDAARGAGPTKKRRGQRGHRADARRGVGRRCARRSDWRDSAGLRRRCQRCFVWPNGPTSAKRP